MNRNGNNLTPAFAELLRHLGGEWSPAGADRAVRMEPGLQLAVAMVMTGEGSGSVRMEVRPIVGWGWYVFPVLLPLALVQSGATAFPSFVVGFVAALGVRFGVSRFVLRGRATARRAQLGRQVNEAMAKLGGHEAEGPPP